MPTPRAKLVILKLAQLTAFGEPGPLGVPVPSPVDLDLDLPPDPSPRLLPMEEPLVPEELSRARLAIPKLALWTVFTENGDLGDPVLLNVEVVL